jgi:hypothetical protein
MIGSLHKTVSAYDSGDARSLPPFPATAKGHGIAERHYFEDAGDSSRQR